MNPAKKFGLGSRTGAALGDLKGGYGVDINIQGMAWLLTAVKLFSSRPAGKRRLPF